MSLREELFSAAKGRDFMLMTSPFHRYGWRSVWAPWLFRETSLGRISDYKSHPVYFRDTGICPLRGSRLGISERLGQRVHEYEYFFAGKLGAFIARNMSKHDTSQMLLSIRKSNDYRNWFEGSHSEHQCFQRALVDGFRAEKYPEFAEEDVWEETDLLFFDLDDKILFVDCYGLPSEQTRCIKRLGFKLKQASHNAL